PPRTLELRLSASADSGTHGRKLYAVFAKVADHGSYIVEGKPSPVGQVIVKESWVPEQVEPTLQNAQMARRKLQAKVKRDDGTEEVVEREQEYLPYARKDGKLYRAAKQADLFIMYKMDPATPGTDRGWVYGTVTADGKTVTSAGRVESCMNCHVQAAQDRLF